MTPKPKRVDRPAGPHEEVGHPHEAVIDVRLPQSGPWPGDFAALVDSLPECVCVIDGAGRLAFASHEPVPALGTVAQRVGAATGADAPLASGLCHPRERGRFDERLDQVLDAGEGARLEVELRAHDVDGLERWVVCTLVNRLRTPGVEGVVATWRDVTDAHLLQSRLAHAATHDPLTGLANRALFNDHLELALANAHRDPERSIAIISVDLDGFKAVNDREGHAAGDELLAQVGHRLHAAARAGDTVARMGGDEFAVLCSGLDDQDQAVAVAARIQSTLRGPYRLSTMAEPVSVTSSIGVSCASNSGPAPELLGQADAALYEAKSRQGDHIAVYGDELVDRITEHRDFRKALRRAVDADELELLYQPIVDLRTGAVEAVEALLRWRHPTLGMLGPVELLDEATDAGLIHDLNVWAVRSGIAQLAEWHREDFTVSVCINVSARELGDPRTLEVFRAMLHGYAVEPGRVRVEVADDFTYPELDSVVKVLSGLKEEGLHISLDGFGSGRSSLAWLRRIPADSLKIDPSVVSSLGDDPVVTQIARATLSIAEGLALDAVGVGVEKSSQLQQLRELGCSSVQGNLISEPLAAHELGAATDRVDGRWFLPGARHLFETFGDG